VIPQGRVTPATLQKRAEEMAKLFAEFADMVKRVQLPESALGQQYIDPKGSYIERSRAKQDWYRDTPTMPLHVVTTPPSEHVEQLQAISRGMANAVRRIRKLEEDVRLLHEAQLATVQDVLRLQESVRRLEHHDGSQQEHG